MDIGLAQEELFFAHSAEVLWALSACPTASAESDQKRSLSIPGPAVERGIRPLDQRGFYPAQEGKRREGYPSAA